MERPYLSIGEVLELLKYEFPDVSISRIRSLESSGHLDLERTASGYRKFYDADVAYLRTLLRGGVGSDGADPARSTNDVSELTISARTAAVRERTRTISADLAEGVEPPEPEFGPDGELPGNPERRHPAAMAATRRANASTYGAGRGAGGMRGLERQATADRATADRAAAASQAGGESPAGAEQVSSDVDVAADARPAAVDVTDDTAALSPTPTPTLSLVESRRSGSGHPASSAAAVTGDPVQVATGPVDAEPPTPEGAQSSATEARSRNPLATNPSGLNLSLDELAGASGVSIETIRDLESLGLLKGQGVFSTVYYDEDAMLTCRLVAQFQTYGVEPRHLRMYKLAADREAAFFEQVVTPQLRRRNPDARERAIETLGELVRLGEQLRVVALRQVLRNAVDRT